MLDSHPDRIERKKANDKKTKVTQRQKIVCYHDLVLTMSWINCTIVCCKVMTCMLVIVLSCLLPKILCVILYFIGLWLSDCCYYIIIIMTCDELHSIM